jgi:alpha-N-arabinofuranosidase
MKATVRVQTDRLIAQASDLLRGHFIEHVHGCLEGGIVDEESSLVDQQGLRTDVRDYFRELKPGILRYPGGNFSCDYDWRQGVLPPEERPRRYNYGTRTTESYRFGTHEFIDYCRQTGAEPMLTVNAGNGSADLAADWVAYCNADGDNQWAALRRANGYEKPFGVKYWAIGNEVYGDWVPGTKTGPEYAAFLKEAVKNMKWSDEKIKIVGMATGQWMPDWDRASIDATVDLVDYVSLHIYVGRQDYYNCVGSPVVIQKGIDIVRGAIENAASKKNITRLPKIALDEYNVWYRTTHFPDRLDEQFNLQDALALAGVQHVLFRNGNDVGMACISMVVNVLGLIRANPKSAFRQTIYWVMKMVADYYTSDVVDCFVDCPSFTCRHPKYFAGVVEVDEEGREIETETQKIAMMEYEGLPYLDVCTMYDKRRRRLVLSVVNRHKTQAIDANILVLGSQLNGSLTGETLTGKSVKTRNTFGSPDSIQPTAVRKRSASNEFTYRFPPHSFTVLSMGPEVPTRKK